MGLARSVNAEWGLIRSQALDLDIVPESPSKVLAEIGYFALTFANREKTFCFCF